MVTLMIDFLLCDVFEWVCTVVYGIPFFLICHGPFSPYKEKNVVFISSNKLYHITFYTMFWFAILGCLVVNENTCFTVICQAIIS